jgi:hypothetical protein
VDCRSSSGSTKGGASATGVISRSRVLYLDDAAAEMGQHHAGVRAGQGAAQVDDRVPGQGPLG